jgi:molecular chaperone DnaK
VVKDAGVRIDSLIFSGGSSRIPLIARMMGELFGVSPVVKINPDEVVALGVAVQASLLEPGEKKMSLHDVTALPLGVEIEGGDFLPILAKNSPLPAEKRRLFTTVSDEQELVEVHVLQGLHRRADMNTSLGSFRLSGIHKTRKGTPKIELTFRVDEDGILQVVARDLDTGVEKELTIKHDADDHEALTPSQLRELLGNQIRRVRSFLEYPSLKFDPGFRREVEAITTAAETCIGSEDRVLVHRHLIALEAVLAELTDRMEEEELRYGRA